MHECLWQEANSFLLKQWILESNIFTVYFNSLDLVWWLRWVRMQLQLVALGLLGLCQVYGLGCRVSGLWAGGRKASPVFVCFSAPLVVSAHSSICGVLSSTFLSPTQEGCFQDPCHSGVPRRYLTDPPLLRGDLTSSLTLSGSYSLPLTNVVSS